MGKSSNGPDWTDVATFMSALDALHGGKTGVLISAGTQAHNGQLHISIMTTFDVLPGSQMAKEVLTESDWPNANSRDLPAWVYGGLYAHDFAIGQAYQQRFFGETA